LGVHVQAILQEVVEMQPVAVIIDSIQTVYLDDVNGSAGSVSQVGGLSACCCWWHYPGAAHSMQPSGSA
jgi:predicted ATP-dependent serine protease